MPGSREPTEAKRTTALALWRYGHDYLKAAKTLCETDRIACNESQVLYHLSAQGIEFALKSFLRTKGVPAEELNARVGHSLEVALDEALAHGLSAPPDEVSAAIHLIAPHHRTYEFRYFETAAGEFPDLAPLLAAGTWILEEIAAAAVTDYYEIYPQGAANAKDEMLRRMRADLQATNANIRT